MSGVVNVLPSFTTRAVMHFSVSLARMLRRRACGIDFCRRAFLLCYIYNSLIVFNITFISVRFLNDSFVTFLL